MSMELLITNTTENYSQIIQKIRSLFDNNFFVSRLTDEQRILFTNFLATLEGLDENFPDWNLRKKMVVQLSVPQNSSSLTDEEIHNFFDQVTVLNGVFHIDLDLLTVYSYVECLEILNQTNTNFDRASLLNSLLDYKNDKQGHELAWLFSEPSARPFEQLESESWFGKIVLIMLFHTTFHWFAMLPAERQENLLENYLWVATQAGVKIAETVGEALYTTTSVAEYMLETNRLRGYVQKNTESIILSDSKKVLVTDFLNSFYSQYEEVGTLERDVKNFIEKNIDPQRISSDFTESVASFLRTMTLLREGVLIERNQAGDENGPELLQRDLYNLVNWFSFERSWPKLVTYFSNQDSLVSVEQFFKQYAKNILISDDSQVAEKFLALTDLLKEKKLVEAEFEPIFFNESTSQFEWNPELLS